MARLSWKQAMLAAASLVSAQSSTNGADGLTATAGPTTTKPEYQTSIVNGTPTTYSVAFTVPADSDYGMNMLPNVKDPQAKQAQGMCPGYKASEMEKTETGFSGMLHLAGAPCNIYGTDIETLKLEVDYQTAHRLRVSIEPAYLDSTNHTHYILDDRFVHMPKAGVMSSDAEDIDLQLSYTNEPSFAFTLVRKSTGDVIFDTTGSVLVYENQFIEFVTQLPENYNLYGMGERMHGFRLGNNFTTTFYAADAGDPIDGNIYGNHPFYLDTRYYEVDEMSGERTLVTTQEVDPAGNYESMSHGTYLRNSHGMEALLQPTNVTWRALGGSIDLYFFDGPTQQEVTSQYQHGAIGLPAMHQYWTLGFHQCRWGYKNWTQVEDVVANYKKFDIPLETVWTDIDYMFQYRDFTNDPNTFPYEHGAEFIDQLHANNQHYIPIVDSAIYIPNPNNASDNYSIYDNGHDMGVFMLNPDGSEYIGSVWPGYTVFPDWHVPASQQWWTESMKSHHDKIAWDGIWIDMSEVSSFCIGSCGSGNLSLNPVHPSFALPGEAGSKIYSYPEGFNLTNATEASAAASADASQASANAAKNPAPETTQAYFIPEVTPGAPRNVNYPPYVIDNINGDLATHAVSPNATHHDGIEEYDVHNLFGHEILNATYHAIASVIPEKRPFVIGRSQFAGSGKWAGHWGGDNTSLFAFMYLSIAQALNYGLFGMPMFGVDSCGFNGNTDEELCNRWMQLSAFFSFYRNHNTLSANSQEAYVWESVVEASKKAMNIRYSLLPYMYTLLYHAHTTGSTFLRALSWEFPNEPLLADIDHQFLQGPSIMIAPVLGQGLTERGVVFPGVGAGTVWYDWYEQTAMDAKPGENVTVSAPLGHIPVYIRGGSVLPMQEPKYTTTESRQSPWSLTCALNQDGTATGQIYIDDGEKIVQEHTMIVDLTASNGTLYASARGTYEDKNCLTSVSVLGVESKPDCVKLNGKAIDECVHYDADSKVLKIQDLDQFTKDGAWAYDWVMTWE